MFDVAEMWSNIVTAVLNLNSVELFDILVDASLFTNRKFLLYLVSLVLFPLLSLGDAPCGWYLMVQVFKLYDPLPEIKFLRGGSSKACQ